MLGLVVPMVGFAQINPNGDWIDYQRTSYQVQADGNLNDLRGDGASMLYRSSLWISGTSFGTDTISHLSAQEYRQNRINFYAGPLSSDSLAGQYWNRTWTVTSGMIDSVKNGLYTTLPESVLNWPVSGRSQYSESQTLAPYVDVNNNGLYEPQSGDYPVIKGDICTIAIFNDWNPRGFFQYWAFEMEGIVWYYMLEGTDIEKRTVFTEYEIWNRSQNSYVDSWISIWGDLDVGAAAANLSGTDIARHTVYAYPYASFAGGQTFQDKTPWGAITILNGPYADLGDGVDNDWDGCIDGVSDGMGNCIQESAANGVYESTTMMHSMAYQNSTQGHNSVPQLDNHYRNYQLGRWPDGNSFLVENPSGFLSTNNGDGYNPGVAMGLSHYIFPGNSYVPDPSFASIPIHDINFFESPLEAHDKRVVGSAGPFTWDPGEKINFAYATVWGTVDTANFSDIIDSLGADIDKLTQAYQTIGNEEFEPRDIEFIVGQSSDYLHIQNPLQESYNLEIIDLYGRVLITGNVSANSETQINTTALVPGVYILRTPDSSYAIKWIKRP